MFTDSLETWISRHFQQILDENHAPTRAPNWRASCEKFRTLGPDFDTPRVTFTLTYSSYIVLQDQREGRASPRLCHLRYTTPRAFRLRQSQSGNQNQGIRNTASSDEVHFGPHDITIDSSQCANTSGSSCDLLYGHHRLHGKVALKRLRVDMSEVVRPVSGPPRSSSLRSDR